MTIFNFTWIAYESAIESSLDTEHSKDKLPVQARKFFKKTQAEAPVEIPHFPHSYRLTFNICLGIEAIKIEIKEILDKYKLDGVAAAAELVRIFRNHIVHGRDKTPLSDGTTIVSHFYAVTRILLFLIQILVLRSLRGENQLVLLSITDEDRGEIRAGQLIRNLHRKGFDGQLPF